MGERRLNGPQTTGRDYPNLSGHGCGFHHGPVGPAATNTVHATTRLLLPAIDRG